ncbi:hypothetical protein RZS08_07635, partial [Arthrospira platensis SPKY1]|nr:hypothetical protein [Arthrospira platensis SPKY1]
RHSLGQRLSGLPVPKLSGTGSTAPLAIQVHGDLTAGRGLHESRQIDQGDIRHPGDVAAVNPLTLIVRAIETQAGGSGNSRAGPRIAKFHFLFEAGVGTPGNRKNDVIPVSAVDGPPTDEVGGGSGGSEHRNHTDSDEGRSDGDEFESLFPRH